MKTKRFLKLLPVFVFFMFPSVYAAEHQDILQITRNHSRFVALIPTKPTPDFRQFMESNPHTSQALNFCLGITATFGAIWLLKKRLDPEVTDREKPRNKK